jgi:hypothetical protein
MEIDLYFQITIKDFVIFQLIRNYSHSFNAHSSSCFVLIRHPISIWLQQDIAVSDSEFLFLRIQRTIWTDTLHEWQPYWMSNQNEMGNIFLRTTHTSFMQGVSSNGPLDSLMSWNMTKSFIVIWKYKSISI